MIPSKARRSRICARRSVGDRMEGKFERILNGLYGHYCVRSGERLVGFVSVISDGVADALLVDLLVHPDFQGKGLGTELVRRVISDLTADGIRSIQVIFNPSLRGFYSRFGFHIVSAGIIDNEVMEHRFDTEG